MQLTFSSEETTNIYIYTRKYAAVATKHNSSRIVGKKKDSSFYDSNIYMFDCMCMFMKVCITCIVLNAQVYARAPCIMIV